MPRATVLIVEDSPDISQPLADAFRYADFEAFVAPDALQGLQLVSERKPDLIIMDIQLPGLDGLSAARMVKADPATKHIPIVAMTAYEIVGTQAKAIGRDCMAYAQKPVRPRELINLVCAILKLSADPPSARRPTDRKPAPPR
jgi:two-component system cell cycle response regulator DivK